jgi:hypothetical protein
MSVFNLAQKQSFPLTVQGPFERLIDFFCHFLVLYDHKTTNC